MLFNQIIFYCVQIIKHMRILTLEEIEKVKVAVSVTVGCEPEIINNETDLRLLGLDSLDTVELIMNLEREFDTVIPDSEAETIRTFENLIHTLQNNIN